MCRGSRHIIAESCGVPNLSRYRKVPQLVALGEALRRARISKGVFQEQLSLLAEVDVSYVGRIERGGNSVAILKLLKLTCALNMTLTELAAVTEL